MIFNLAKLRILNYIVATDMALVKFSKAQGKEEPTIHGFSILFFISAIGVLTALTIKKKLKNFF